MNAQSQRRTVGVAAETHALASQVADREGRTLTEILRRAVELYAERSDVLQKPRRRGAKGAG